MYLILLIYIYIYIYIYFVYIIYHYILYSVFVVYYSNIYTYYVIYGRLVFTPLKHISLNNGETMIAKNSHKEHLLMKFFGIDEVSATLLHTGNISVCSKNKRFQENSILILIY